MGYLIDTCVWIDVEDGTISAADLADITGDHEVFVSPVTIAEMRHGIEITPPGPLRTKRLALFQRIERLPCMPIDDSTGQIFGIIASQVELAGRKVRTRTQDLWIAAQAIQYNYKLITRNGKDFQHIPGLELVNIPIPAQ